MNLRYVLLFALISSSVFADTLVSGNSSSRLNPSLSVKDSVQELKPMFITATRTGRLPVTIPNTVHIVTREQIQIEGMVRTTPDALAKVPGVMVQKTSYGQASPYLRGFTGMQTLFMIDGVRLNNSVFRSGPNQYWSTVDPFSLDRLEVTKGPSSVLYGSDAIGGVVNAITSLPEPSIHSKYVSPRLYYRYSTAENSHEGRIETSVGIPDKITIYGGFSPKLFDDLRIGGGKDRLPKTGYQEYSGDAKVQYSITDKDVLTALYQKYKTEDVWRTHSTKYGYSWKGTKAGSDLERSNDQDRQLAYLKYSGYDKLGFIDQITLRFSYHQQKEEEYRIKKDTTSSVQGFDVNTFGLGMQADFKTPAGKISIGADGYRDYVNSSKKNFTAKGVFKSNDIQGPVADDATYDDAGAFVQDELQAGRVSLITGLRYSYFRVNAEKVVNPVVKGDTMQIRESWNSCVGSARVIGRIFDANQLNLFAGVSQGFRAPNLSDMTRFDIARSNEFEIPTTGLKPEQYINSEIGVKGEFDILGYQLCYFYTDIDNMIIRTPTGDTTASGNKVVNKKNSGKGFVHGVEADFRVHLFNQIEINGAFFWNNGKLEVYPNSSLIMKEEALTRLMPAMVDMSIKWDPQIMPLWFSLSGKYAAKQDKLSSSDIEDKERIPPGGTSSYATVDFNSGWKICKEVQASFAVKNIGDKNYRIHGSGINEPSRNFVFGLSFQY